MQLGHQRVGRRAVVDIRMRGGAGVLAESRNVVCKKTEVEVFPVVDLSEESAFFVYFVLAMQHRLSLIHI